MRWGQRHVHYSILLSVFKLKTPRQCRGVCDAGCVGRCLAEDPVAAEPGAEHDQLGLSSTEDEATVQFEQAVVVGFVEEPHFIAFSWIVVDEVDETTAAQIEIDVDDVGARATVDGGIDACDDGVVTGAARQGIPATATVDEIVAITTVDGVIAAAAEGNVIILFEEHAVVTLTAKGDVVTFTAVQADVVVRGIPVELVVVEDVVLGAALVQDPGIEFRRPRRDGSAHLEAPCCSVHKITFIYKKSIVASRCSILRFLAPFP